MSCCKGPRTGKDFDPDCEGPSACDIERFGSDEWEQGEDALFDEQTAKAPSPIIFVGMGLAVLAILAFVLLR
ncbi:MAG: hypothetical protein EA380_01735 [Phycisphaeraceae bacterium]|nr:MAG: hypothetical protein EA380_01735 [Phycisphaeraceae bacterium]